MLSMPEVLSLSKGMSPTLLLIAHIHSKTPAGVRTVLESASQNIIFVLNFQVTRRRRFKSSGRQKNVNVLAIWEEN